MARSRRRSTERDRRDRRSSSSGSKSRRRSRSRERRGRSRKRGRSSGQVPPERETHIRAPPACAEYGLKIADWLAKVAPAVHEEVRARVVAKLQEAGYEYDWQAVVLPREVLLHVFPPVTHGTELTAMHHAQHMARSVVGAESSDVAFHLQQILAQQKQQTKATKGLEKPRNQDEVSSSDSGEDQGFDATECLKKYGLPSIDHGHLLPFDLLKTLVKAAGKRKKKSKDSNFDFLVDRDIHKCMPRWLKDKDRPPKGEMTHSHWVAAWWSRALGQLSVQAAIGHETVPFEALLNEFLHCNKMAVQETVRTAQSYDADLWSDMSEAIKRKDKACNPTKAFHDVDENRHTRARDAAYANSAVGRPGKGFASKAIGKGTGKPSSTGVRDNRHEQGRTFPPGDRWDSGYGDRGKDGQWNRGHHHVENGMRTNLPWIKK